jgi:hydroxypyruvate isomerase
VKANFWPVLNALEYAVATDSKRLHAMAGNLPAGADRREGTAVYVSNLRRAANRVALYGITLLIEPLNKRDNPGISSTRPPRPWRSSAKSGVTT